MTFATQRNLLLQVLQAFGPDLIVTV